MGFPEPAQAALDGGRVGQHPAVDRAVIDRNDALRASLDVAGAQSITQVGLDQPAASARLPAEPIKASLGIRLQHAGERHE